MKRATPGQAERSQILNREAVLMLLLSYKPDRHVTWSGSRVLYRLKISKSKDAPADIKRRANRILADLASEGVLKLKGTIMSRCAGSIFTETGYVRSARIGA